MKKNLAILRKKISTFLRDTKVSETPQLQEYFFRLALAEIGVWGGEIKTDHKMGRCFHKKTGWVQLVFPESLIRLTSNLPKNKDKDYFFRGKISDGREWLLSYPNTTESEYGRNPSTKYSIDIDYYQNLAVSKYGLAPIGGCPWSYRFFEAIMCHAIPILGKDDIDIYSDKYIFFRHGEKHSYNLTFAQENYHTFINNHTLRRFS